MTDQEYAEARRWARRTMLMSAIPERQRYAEGYMLGLENAARGANNAPTNSDANWLEGWRAGLAKQRVSFGRGRQTEHEEHKTDRIGWRTTPSYVQRARAMAARRGVSVTQLFEALIDEAEAQ